MSLPPALWRDLRRFTPARVGLGRVGNGLPTAEHLAFQAAHAAARDAVHAELDTDALAQNLALPCIRVHSACPDRQTYLLRPDLGRTLLPADRDCLARHRQTGLAIVLCDGLSALAVQRHAAPLVNALLDQLQDRPADLVVASQGRVALGDAIAAARGADAVLVLIGERPGLSTPDSLGAYLTWAPRIGRTDAERNCVSNIRPDGLPIPQAATKLAWLIQEMTRRRLSGVDLKDEQPALSRDPSLVIGQPASAAFQ